MNSFTLTEPPVNLLSDFCGRRHSAHNRRDFLARTGSGFGMLALAGLLKKDQLLGESAKDAPLNPLAPRAGHYRPRAKAVIWLFMEGGPSGFDLFDPKPELQRRHGQRVQNIQTFFGNPGPLLKSPFAFKQYGQSGAWVSEVYPQLARHVDDLAFIKSCYAESNNHAPAMFQMNTGMTRAGFPSAGSWVTYGLGTDNQNLPGYVVLGNQRGSKGGPLNWSNGFLPSTFQGTPFRPGTHPILNLSRPGDVTQSDQRAQIDLLAGLNRLHESSHPGEPDLLARIENYELAFRMQREAGAIVDLSGESQATRHLYGLDQPKAAAFGTKCLLARRLVESGVRFVQVYCDEEWDAHGDIAGNHRDMAAQTDHGIHGLLTDLKSRGLWDDVLIVWGGEFGRMPVSEGGKGRDHNPHGFCVWFAGAGIRGGVSHGATDEVGYEAVQDRVSIHDLHATILHLLGLNHERLTYHHNGRNFRLTDVSGELISPILA
jgi:hypothetical protein